MEELKPFVLLDDLKLHEKIIEKIISGLLYGVCGIHRLPHLIYDGFRSNKRGFKIQAKKYVENNETIYTSAKKNPLNNGFLDAGTITKLLIRSAEFYSNTPCMGRRKIVRKAVEKCPVLQKDLVKYEFGEYIWKTYSEVHREIINTAQKLVDLKIGVSNKFALFCNTSSEWLTMAYALMFVSSPVVTVYSTLSDAAIIYALKQTEVVGIMVDERTLPRLKPMLEEVTSIKYVVVSRYVDEGVSIPPEISEMTECFKFEEFVTYKSETNYLANQPMDSNTLAFIMYTSGTTGDPKGVMISHKNVLAVLESVSGMKIFLRSSNNNQPHRYPAYLPSSHIFECVFEIAMITLGHSIAFSTPLTLFDTSPMIMKGSRGDLSEFGPTVMITVPLLLERVKKQVLEQLKSRTRMKQLIFQSAYNVKMRFRELGQTTPVIDNVVFKVLRQIFGGKLQLAYIGGAYIPRETEEFANICFGEFRQGYGLTESTSGVLAVKTKYFRTGSCGCPVSNFEYKLIDWPEGNRYSNDELRPSGEVAISADSLAMGYYRNEELTKENFIVDPNSGKRWFLTGDIGVILPDMTLKIVDRKKDIIKLSNGEYISLIKVESTIIECPIVEMVCVIPNMASEFLVAIIVPQREKTQKYLKEIAVGNDSDDIENMLGLKEVREQLAEYVKSNVAHKLQKNELPNKFIIVQDLWLPENNLVTPTMKIKRREISKKYKFLLD